MEYENIPVDTEPISTNFPRLEAEITPTYAPRIIDRVVDAPNKDNRVWGVRGYYAPDRLVSTD
jgi:hypothetical protein